MYNLVDSINSPEYKEARSQLPLMNLSRDSINLTFSNSQAKGTMWPPRNMKPFPLKERLIARKLKEVISGRSVSFCRR